MTRKLSSPLQGTRPGDSSRILSPAGPVYTASERRVGECVAACVWLATVAGLGVLLCRWLGA